MKVRIVIVFLVLALSVVPARAATIRAAIPGADFSLPATIGTFTYSLPAGSVITHLTLFSPLYSFAAATHLFALETDFDGMGVLSLPISPPTTEFFMGSDCTFIVPYVTWDGSLDLSVRCWLDTCPSTYTLVSGGYWYLDIDFEGPERTVSIDIKPSSFRSSINPKSKGKIPVAILSTEDFYAPNEVNQNSLTFGSTGDEDSLAFCNQKGEDVNGDGLKDLVCHFNTESTGFLCGDTHGVLKGMTMDGTPIQGSDSVIINPCK